MKMVRFFGLFAGFDVEVSLVFLIGEAGKSQDSRRVRRRGVSAELPRDGVQETLGLFEIHALDFPYDLMLPGRTIQHEAWLRDDAGILDSFDSFPAAMVQVNVDVFDASNLFLCPRRSIFLKWVHPYIDVRAVRVLVAKPGLEFRTCGFLSARNALDGLAKIPVEYEDGNAIGGFKIVEDIF